MESQQRNELHFIAVLANKQLRAVISGDFSRCDARKNFIAQHFFVRLRVRAFRPPVPIARNHVSVFFMLMLPIMIVFVLDRFSFDYEHEHEQE